MSLPRELAEWLRVYCEGTGKSEADAVREVLWQRAAATPEHGAVLAAGHEVVNKMRRFVIERTMVTQREISDELKLELDRWGAE